MNPKHLAFLFLLLNVQTMFKTVKIIALSPNINHMLLSFLLNLKYKSVFNETLSYENIKSVINHFYYTSLSIYLVIFCIFHLNNVTS